MILLCSGKQFPPRKRRLHDAQHGKGNMLSLMVFDRFWPREVMFFHDAQRDKESMFNIMVFDRFGDPFCEKPSEMIKER